MMNEDEISIALKKLPGWNQNGNSIEKEFVFPDFKTAMTVMNAIAFEAEELDHHPDWSNVYNKLNIQLSTHHVGGITTKDFDLAERIERITGHFLTKVI